MSVKIRLQRQGRKKRPFYQIVIADSKSPRDGRFIEKIGSYNPLTKPATIEIDHDKAYEWIQKGAQPTDTVRAILRFKGVLFRKHVQLGVKKGAFSQEEADAKVKVWMEEKSAKISSRKEKADKEISDFKAKVAGSGHVAKPKAEPKVEIKAEAAVIETPMPAVEPEMSTPEPEVIAEMPAPEVEQIESSSEEESVPVIEEEISAPAEEPANEETENKETPE